MIKNTHLCVYKINSYKIITITHARVIIKHNADATRYIMRLFVKYSEMLYQPKRTLDLSSLKFTQYVLLYLLLRW